MLSQLKGSLYDLITQFQWVPPSLKMVFSLFMDLRIDFVCCLMSRRIWKYIHTWHWSWKYYVCIWIWTSIDIKVFNQSEKVYLMTDFRQGRFWQKLAYNGAQIHDLGHGEGPDWAFCMIWDQLDQFICEALQMGFSITGFPRHQLLKQVLNCVSQERWLIASVVHSGKVPFSWQFAMLLQFPEQGWHWFLTSKWFNTDPGVGACREPSRRAGIPN